MGSATLPSSKKARPNSPMNRTLDIITGQELQSITAIDGQGGVLRFDPFPFVRMGVANLECSDGLTEEESEGAEIYGCRYEQNENLVEPWRGIVHTYRYVQGPSSRASHSPPACTSSTSCNGSDTAER
jgi:hypothetical protein